MPRRTIVATLSASLVAALSVASAGPSDAAYRLCALRDGPRGPCTCKNDGDGPGQFTTVPKSRCRAETPKDGAAVDAATPVAAPGAPAANEPAKAEAQQPAAPVAPAMTAPESVAAPAPPETTGALPVPPSAGGTGKLDQVRARGKLICGVNTGLLGFSARTDTGVWSGLDVTFCHALAAAVFGDADKAEFVPLENSERFDALTSGRIDVLSRNTTWTMNREVDLGLRFAGILYFDGQGFMTSDERGFVSAQQLNGSKVCVEAGTTTEKNMAFYFKAHEIDAQVMSFPTRDETLKAYTSGACDTFSGDRSALYSFRASLPEPNKHAILPEVISKEPLGPVVLKSDDEWAEIVRWTLAGLVNAEEVGLDRASAATTDPLNDDAQRLVEGAGASGEKLRLSKTWLRETVAAVGNYGEIFEANVGKESPLGMERGLNALWKRGGILSAPPMW
ncbi:amino acid ABC transporter substrate-binding protein [Hyphomicrobium sp.]|uniref:amino acid ABC transporter substrate-binding protein n=1 Tax=Hyphomicrobium sp. TaxID=82 RepID=UPI003F720864